MPKAPKKSKSATKKAAPDLSAKGAKSKSKDRSPLKFVLFMQRSPHMHS